ncbi:MAG TPA: chromate transporter [Ktedonobacteraceae bacterium]|nr:chromate transporter [Ktedonobacteraceae bacterium]
MQNLPATSRPSVWKLFFLWGGIGLQSFGGGASTMFLIQQTFIEKYAFITREEFLHFFSLCAFTPGINIVALTILIGRKLGGALGILVSILGLLVPSATITCLCVVLFAMVQHAPVVQAILHGVVPATAGVMFVVGLGFVKPLFERRREEGWPWFLACLLMIAACALAIILFNLSVIPVLLAAALLGIVIFRSQRINPEDVPPISPVAPINREQGGK